MRNLHVPLPEELYGRLREEAERSDRPATVLAREAIESWLKERKRAALHDAIAAFAERHAGTGADLDEQLEAASSEHLFGESGEQP